MSVSTLSTGRRTMLVGIGLVVAYVGYSQVTSPWLTVEHRNPVLPKASLPEEKSPVFAEQAHKWFEKDPWVQNANGRFRDKNRLMFFNQHELFNDNRSIRIKPVAFLWGQKDGEMPITATADSAQLDASTKFSFEEGQFGKITSGLLAGDVRITGPDGLSMEGRMFHISEDAMKVWTGQPVKFAWGDHSGRAEGGAEIELLPSTDSASAGLLAISDVQRIRLRGRITCDLMFKDDDDPLKPTNQKREPVHLKINAANGFEFFVPTREATFSGFVDRKPQKDNQILVERPTADGARDLLFCSKLILQLQPRIQEEGEKKRSGQLQLTQISAEGQPVLYSSQKDGKEQTHARMRLLKFRIGERLLDLLEGVAAASGTPVKVEVHQDGSKLTSGRVLVQLDDKNNVTSVECRGPGQLGPSDRATMPRDKDAMDASWMESLFLQRGDEYRVTVTGEAKVFQPATEMSLAGNVIDMILEASAEKAAEVTETGGPAAGLNVSKLRPQSLVVSGNVVLGTSEMNGIAREKLTVRFEDAAEVNPAENNAIRPVSQSSESEKRPLSGTTDFSSDTLEAVALLMPSNKLEFQDVWLKGAVVVNHQSAKKTESFTAEGNVLFAKAGFQGGREISLFGDPATVVNSSNRIEGKRIDLAELKEVANETQRTAKVEGSGRIRFVVKTGLNGKLLAKQSPLDIYWGDYMTFSGRTAHFVGNIRAIMNNEIDHDVEITCAGLKVHFTDDVELQSSTTGKDFQLAEPRDEKTPMGEIERIECESRVVVDIDMMENGVVVAKHHAEFSDLEFNQITGDFHARGPGLIESVQPDKGKKLTTSNRAVVKANTPVKTSDSAFVFLRATFISELEGNRDERFVHLRQHVRGVFGPVRDLTERIEIDGLSVEELPENTGSIGCENLSVSAIPGETPDKSSFSLVAECNSTEKDGGTRSPCRLESKLFSGDADKITYDHSKQQFILRADEGRQAKVSYRPDGGEQQSLTGRRFEYYSDRNQLNANQITGVQGSGEL